jgi:hypothetical protein
MEATADTTSGKSEDELIADAMDALDKPASAQPPAAPQAQREPQPPQPQDDTDMPTALSPTLEKLDSARRPKPGTLCEVCPNSVWFTSPKEVKCYCRVMYLVVWGSKEPNQITGCDGIYVGQDE